MKLMRRFEENLEFLGFDMAPVAWDIANMDLDDDQRMLLLNALTEEK